jgi:D-serine deaminase-like pyridoxal phosphate-dependent protein
MSNIPSSFLYQSSPNAALKAQYIGQRIEDVQAPAAVIDLAVVKRNCALMLKAANALDVQFRAHVKTHKVCCDFKNPVKISHKYPDKGTSTIASGKNGAGQTDRVNYSGTGTPDSLAVAMYKTRTDRRCMSAIQVIERLVLIDPQVLYGVPASPSSLPRLAKLAHVLGGSKYLALMVDHVDTLDFISRSSSIWPGPVRIFVKIDTGYHRSGITWDSSQLNRISYALSNPGAQEKISLLGLYSHLGHSYSFNSPLESLQGLITEFDSLEEATRHIRSAHSPLVLSVGATPTATVAQHFNTNPSTADPETETIAQKLLTRLEDLRKLGLILELHAGVYPVLDLQQLATHARNEELSYANIGLRILTEVASLYPERSNPEALIAAGSLALGREPCKSYPGWGIVTPWTPKGSLQSCSEHYKEDKKTGWIVGKVSQEHGILTWEGEGSAQRPLQIGQKLMVWPNHACVAGAGFGWYFVVDSDSEDRDVVRDIWVRCRGW